MGTQTLNTQTKSRVPLCVTPGTSAVWRRSLHVCLSLLLSSILLACCVRDGRDLLAVVEEPRTAYQYVFESADRGTH